MSKGVIYVMETIVPGLVKIGKTQTNRFQNRMYILERNGYNNITGLKRRFAIEVENYEEKESMLDNLLKRNSIYGSELFSLNIDLVIQLLSSFEGRQVYPLNETKEEIFIEATTKQEGLDLLKVPNGIYFLKRKKEECFVDAKMEVRDGTCIVLKGSICASNQDLKGPKERKLAKIENHVLQEDVRCKSPSTAGFIALGYNNNGWVEWKTEKGLLIDSFRKNDFDFTLPTKQFEDE